MSSLIMSSTGVSRSQQTWLSPQKKICIFVNYTSSLRSRIRIILVRPTVDVKYRGNAAIFPGIHGFKLWSTFAISRYLARLQSSFSTALLRVYVSAFVNKQFSVIGTQRSTIFDPRMSDIHWDKFWNRSYLKTTREKNDSRSRAVA